LREDWLRRRQAEPLWIRPDGVVRNGNRRLAMLKRLRREGHDISWVEAIVLEPTDVDEAELFRMEQREQLAENFKKRYADINALLALKEAADLEGIDWDDPASVREMAARLKHYAGRDDAAYALVQLQAVRAVTAYLAHLNVPGRYSLATGQVEVFREVGKCMSMFEDEPEDGYELVLAAFAFVQAGKKYQQLRALRKMFSEDRERFRELVRDVQAAEQSAGWSPDQQPGEVVSADMDIMTAQADEDEPDEPEAVAPAGYPKHDVAPIIDRALDAYAATLLDVTTQLTQALSRLRAVEPAALASATAGDGAPQVRALVDAIAEWAEAARATA
jgi:hypothetical protein